MKVIVQSKTLVVTAALRKFVTNHAMKLLKYSRKIAQVTVFLELVKRKKNDTHAAIAKFLIQLPGKDIVVTEKAADLYLAVAEATRATMRQISKVKNRIKQQRALRGANFRGVNVRPAFARAR